MSNLNIIYEYYLQLLLFMFFFLRLNNKLQKSKNGIEE